MRIYIGIDPGKGGGIAAIRKDGTLDFTLAMPIAGKEVDFNLIAEVIYERYSDFDCIACIEKVSAMPGQGVTSMFSFGFVTGGIHGILAALNIPRYLVTPQAWKKLVLAGTSQDKNAAIDYCRRAYPNTSLLATERSKKPHTGIADAICIAKYALLTH